MVDNGRNRSMINVHTLLRVCAAGAVACCLVSAGGVAAQDQQSLDQQLERDLSVAQKPIYEIYQLRPARHIEVDAWVDRANRVYAVGEPLRLTVRPFQDAYITVVDVGTSGNVSLLFPNHFQSASRVRAGATVSIPTRSARWEIKAGGPAGIDLIQVIASRSPLTLPEFTQLVRSSADRPFVTLGRSAEDVARDLVPQLKPEPAAGSRVPPGFGVHNVLVRVTAG
jgi:Domain of unknown function (DUF4384)